MENIFLREFADVRLVLAATLARWSSATGSGRGGDAKLRDGARENTHSLRAGKRSMPCARVACIGA
jgi:hypothetical protein